MKRSKMFEALLKELKELSENRRFLSNSYENAFEKEKAANRIISLFEDSGHVSKWEDEGES